MIGPRKGKQATNGREPDHHRVGDPPPRILVGPVDQREVQDRQEQDQQIDHEAEAAAFDPEVGERGHRG